MLLQEFHEFNYTIEEDVKDKPLKISGVFQKCGEINSNRRSYPKSLWERVFSDEKIKRRLKERRILGELDHPKDGKTSLMRAAMVITDLGMQEDGFIRGVYEVLNTPSGQVLKELHRAGVRLGISSRGDGELEASKEGSVVLPESYRFETFDVVLDPSVDEAYPSILKEAIQSARDLEDTLYQDSLPALVEKFESLSQQVRTACAHVAVPEDKKLKATEEETKMDVRESQEYKELQAQLATEKQRADAATSTAEELLIQAKTAQWNSNHMKESLDGARNLNEKYETAKSIIEEMADELRKVRGVKQEMAALRKVATTMYEFIQDGKMAEAIRGMLSGTTKEVREALMPIISRCTTEEEVQATVSPLLESGGFGGKKSESKVPIKKEEPVALLKEIKEDKTVDGGKPLAEEKVVPKPEAKKDTYVATGSRVIQSMGKERENVIALTRALVESRKRQLL